MGLSIVQDGVSHETVEALTDLLKDAQAGNISGIAFVAITPTGHNLALVGSVKTCPVFTRGMLRCLDDQLAHYTLPK